MLEWMTEADELLAGQGVMEAARLAWMLGAWDAGEVAAFEVHGSRVAWCRLDGLRVRCVAVAPDDGRRRVREPEFFAAPFPDDWTTKRRASRRDVAWPDDGFAFGMMADGRLVLAKARAGREVQPSADAPWMRCEDHAAKSWHVLTARLRGAAELWRAARVTFNGYPAFRLALWRADDPGAARDARRKAGEAAKASRAARKSATR